MSPANEDDDPLDALLEECLDAPLAEQQDVLEALAAAHTDMAEELRARYGQLRDAGLLQSARHAAGVFAVEPLSEGRRFGEFRILRELGRGGMGVVYLAEQVSMRRKVALKLLRTDILAHPRIRQRFRREVEAASSLEHPGISTIYEAGEVDDTPYIAMRYVRGETLRSRIHAPGRGADGASRSSRSSTQAGTMAKVQLIEHVARALHHAHERGFIHRDVKPGNVMVSEEDEPVLLDFGLARAEAGTGECITMSGDALGTPAYMSPEQISPDGGQIDRRTDVYSLGVTLFEYLTGRTPFEAPTREELYRLILTTGRLDTGHARLPRDLQVVLETALARDRNRRYHTALDFAEDLRRVRGHEPIAARRSSVVERAWSWTRREPLKATLLALAPALCLLGGYVWARADEIDAGADALRQVQLDVALAEGFTRLNTGAPRAAAAAFRRARSIAPGNREAAAGLAFAVLAEGDEAAAAQLIAGLGPTSFEARCVSLARQAQDPEASLASLPEPGTATEHFLFGRVVLHHLAPGNHRWKKRAQAAFLQAIARSHRARLHYFVSLAWVSDWLLDAPWLRTSSRTLAELWPDQPVAVVAVALALRRIDPDAARAATRRLERWPDDPYVTYVRSQLALRLDEDPARAARLLEPILGQMEGDAHLLCAQAFFDAGERDRARAVLNRGIERFPSALHLRARLASFQGDLRACEAAYRKIVAQEPRNSNGHVSLAECLERRGDASALAHAQRAVDLDPGNWDGHRLLARALCRAGRQAEARAVAARLLDTDPETAKSWRTAAWIAAKGKDCANAAAFYRRADQLDPERTPLYDFGLAEQQLGHFRAAAAHYRKWLTRDPTHAESLINLGLSLAWMGDLETGLPLLEKGEALGSTQKDWTTRTPLIERLRQTLRARAASRPTEADLATMSPSRARHFGDEAYWRGEDRRCVRVFRSVSRRGLPWTPQVRFSIRWAAHAAVRVGDAVHRTLARAWLDHPLRSFEDQAASAEPSLRLLMHQELYSWLTHDGLAAVRQGTGLETLPDEERAEWQTFWRRARTLFANLDPFRGASGVLENQR